VYVICCDSHYRIERRGDCARAWDEPQHSQGVCRSCNVSGPDLAVGGRATDGRSGTGCSRRAIANGGRAGSMASRVPWLQPQPLCALQPRLRAPAVPILRRHHAAAEKVFVDYSGKTVPIVGSKSGIHSRNSTIRRSIAPTPGWRRISRSASCRPDRTNQSKIEASGQSPFYRDVLRRRQRLQRGGSRSPRTRGAG
jgi:hypothetical protein